MAGTNIYIENQEKNDSFTTDFEGEAIIKIPKDKNLIRLYFMGPNVRFKILRPTDYIVIDLDSKKVWYYFKGKKIKKKKIKAKIEEENKQKVTLKVGDRVRMIDGKAIGTIDVIEKTKATVNFGIFTSKVSLDQLEYVQPA